jgi:hypothetical protein
MTKENLTSFHARYDDVDSAIKSLLNFMFFFFSVLVYCAKTRGVYVTHYSWQSQGWVGEVVGRGLNRCGGRRDSGPVSARFVYVTLEHFPPLRPFILPSFPLPSSPSRSGGEF